RKFSTLKFSVNNRQFSVTFSAGIAEFPRFQDMPALIDAANQALYQAKAEGRNRVRLANC
ncbi:MAG: diguanylate cyclase, partial [Methylococcaceae bacterium]|nr:diguanylate cyclase [Methylococcaceae bacterium]